MISQGAWIVALFVVLAGQRLPRNAMIWAGLGIALYAAATVAIGLITLVLALLASGVLAV